MGAPPGGAVSFLFTDIEGSTHRWERQRQAMALALERHDSLLRQAIEAEGGLVFKTVGDAFCAAFASPLDALLAALAGQRGLAAEDWSAFAPAFAPLRVRMALHTGLADPRDGDYFGPALNRVARLLGTGHGGQVLLSLATEELLRDRLPAGVALRDLGWHRLKDLGRPERVFQLVAPGLPTAFPELRSMDARPNNLPIQPTPLFGRDGELQQIERLLQGAEPRLLSLVGPGGVGKTRLALQAAAQLLDGFPAGAWLVDLSDLGDPTFLPASIAASIGIRASPDEPILATLLAWLPGQRCLLVCDGFEHLTHAAGTLAQLLARGDGLRILVTSREALHLSGEQVLRVSPLPLPRAIRGRDEPAGAQAAVDLFVDRARRARSDFRLDGSNTEAVASICARLDGLPLAIELAAARVVLLAPAEILARLDRSLRLLTGGARDRPDRHRTMRAAIEWTHALLDEEAQRCFRRLAVFRGGFDLDAAEGVVDPEDGATLDRLAELVEKSLVQHSTNALGSSRYRMLRTVRELGWERLEASGERLAIRERHADWYCEMAGRARPGMRGARQQDWITRLDQERENIRAALEHDLDANPERGLLLAGRLEYHWWMSGGSREALTWIDRLWTATQAPGPAPRAFASSAAGTAAYWTGDFESALAWHERAREAFERLEAPCGVAMALANMAVQHQRLGQKQPAEACLILARRWMSDCGEDWVGLQLSGIEGLMAFENGRSEAGIDGLRAMLTLARQVADPRLLAMTLNNLGYTLHLSGADEEAEGLLREAVKVFGALGHADAGVMDSLGRVLVARGALGPAAEVLREGLANGLSRFDRTGIIQCLEGLAICRQAQGAHRASVLLTSAADALREQTGYALPENERGDAARRRSDLRVRLGEVAFGEAWQFGQTEVLARVLEQAAAVDSQAPL